MAEEIDSENGRISNSEGVMTLTLDGVTWHTIDLDLDTETN